MSKVKTTADTP